MSEARLVIVGSGIAGVSAAGAARLAGYEGEIVLLGDEPELPYRRPPVSKEVVRGEKSADDIRIRKAEWYETQRIDVRTGVRAESIDVDNRLVRLADGTDLAYTSLLIATGGRARSLPGPVSGTVLTLRTLADVDAVAAALRPGAALVIVGAGLIDSEIAASARERGADVTLLETADLPMPHVLPANLGQMYADVHAEQGTMLHTSVEVVSIEGDAERTVVTAADGRSWEAPVVVLAVGMTPVVELAVSAGIEADHLGIVVDDRGRTSAPDVYAAGDVARLPSSIIGRLHRVEHWQGAQNHGSAVGKVIAGHDVAFDEVPWCWSDQYDLTLQVTGWPSSTHDVVVRGSLDDRDFAAFYLDRGVIRGAVGIGRPAEIRLARQWIAARVTPDVAALGDNDADLASAA